MTGFDSTGRGMDRRGFLSLAAKTAVGLSVFSRMPEAFAGGSAVASGKLRSIMLTGHSNYGALLGPLLACNKVTSAPTTLPRDA